MDSIGEGLEDGLQKCFISEDIAARMGGLTGGNHRLKAGNRHLPVQLIVDKGLEPGSMVVSKKILAELLLPDGGEISIAPINGELCLGPVVGCFINQTALRHIAAGRTNFRTTELMKGNLRAHCLLYFFSIADVRWLSRQINGFYYDNDQNRWSQRSFPLPDIIYDRGGGFRALQKPVARYIRQQLKQIPGLQFFNAQHYFNKWDLYVRLSRHPELKPYLPETLLYTHPSDLYLMLRKYGCVYVKSVLGSNGRDVMRIIAEGDHYRYNHCKETMVDDICPDLEHLEAVIKDFLRGKQLIIQQGINVLQVNASNVDLRVLAQRNAVGEWELTDMPVRLGREGCAITSTRSGSSVYPFEEAFKNFFLFTDEKVQEMRREIGELAMTNVRAIEDEYGRFGELGTDIAVDKSGHLWILETNAKPGKDTVRLTGDENALEKAFFLPLEYCKFLAKFTEQDGMAFTIRVRSENADSPNPTGPPPLEKPKRRGLFGWLPLPSGRGKGTA